MNLEIKTFISAEDEIKKKIYPETLDIDILD